MKKIVFIFLVIISFSASAQRYTLQFGQREPTFYYWDRNWIDCCDLGVLKGTTLPNVIGLIAPRTLLRFCTTEDTLKIIGIASACRIHQRYGGGVYDGQVYDSTTRFPEYFQLYDATASGPVLLAETQWDTAHPRYQITFPSSRYDSTYINGHGYSHITYFTDTIPIYEAFFDKPILVADSFYVGGTSNNLLWHYEESTNQYSVWMWEHLPVEYAALYKHLSGGGLNSMPCQPLQRRIITYRDYPQVYTHATGQEVMEGYLNHQSDTNWHHNGYYGDGFGYWLCFFPIIDTTGMGLDGFQWVPGYGCDTVRTFRLLYVEGRQAYLSWNANRDALSYEVSYGPEGTTPEQGIKVQLNTSMACLDSLEPGRRYVAYVRAHCADNAKSPWTEGVTFRIPESDGAIEDASLASRFTTVMPNPATTQATVISSFTINRIEVYTAAGQHVLTTEPRANAAALDLSTLSAGTYLLRIQTSAGDTAKKLVVQ